VNLEFWQAVIFLSCKKFVNKRSVPVLHLLTGNKNVFCRHAGATHCPDKCEIWHGEQPTPSC